MGRESTLPPGSKIKETYQVVRKVASGGMGEVYLVRHLHLDVSYALKLMLPQWAREPKQVSRFQDEARLMAHIQHPNVARVFDSGEVNGHPYLIMEWLEGETLYDRAERTGRLPQAEVVDICWGIATALQVVHDQGIVHRDIKPSNVFLCPETGGGYRVKVLDFGIARIPRRQDVTVPGTVLGTPEYMAPEQARGASQAIGAWTDQYALAMVAYRLLNGAPAFSCPDNLPALLYRIEMMEPPPLPADIPESVQTVIRRALSKNPTSRYESVQGFAEALDLAVNPPAVAVAETQRGELSQTIPPSTLVPPPGAGRLRWVTSSIAALTTVLVALLVWKLVPFPISVPVKVAAAAPIPDAAFAPLPDLAPPSVHWQLHSTPEGAEIYDVLAKAPLGKTPWTKVVAAGSEQLQVELRLAYYRTESTTLKAAHDELRTVVLVPNPRCWQVLSESAGARVVNRTNGQVLGPTPWKFCATAENPVTPPLRVEAPHMMAVEVDLNPQRGEDKLVNLHPFIVTPPPAAKLAVLCVDGKNLEARNATVIALNQAGILTLRANEWIVIRRDGASLVVAENAVAALDEVKQRIVESALRELLRGKTLPDQLIVKCTR